MTAAIRFGVIFFLLTACARETPDTANLLKPASSFFPAEKTQVMVLGTFHFDYPGLDVNKTSDEDKIDVLKEPKKSEVTEVVEYIKKFKPTKIAIEARGSWNATSKLREYMAGKHRDERDERFQLAMRLAAETGLDTLYAIDMPSWDDELAMRDTTYFRALFADYDFKSDDPYNQLIMDWYKAQDKMISRVNLLEYLKHINSRESHRYDYGAYLVGDFKLDDSRGADILSIWWYNRNLRIFRKIQDITEGKDDRILVVIGNGHAAVLRQLLESSPEYEFVELNR